MPTLLPLARHAQRGRRWVAPEALNVAPSVVGLALASPVQRAMAMGVDLLAVALLSGASDLWLFAGLAIVAMQLRDQRLGKDRKQALGWVLAALLLVLALGEGVSLWKDRGEAARDKVVAATTAAASAPVLSAEEDAALPHRAAGLSDSERLVLLEAELAELRKHKPLTWRKQVDSVLEAVGASFGWGIVYFSLLPAWWGGQTLGKRLLGLRVVELTGKPPTVLHSLKRYGGYAAGMATGGLGFAQVLWDPNRQGLQDKAAHTVVVDLRAPARPAAPDAQAALPDAPQGAGSAPD